MDTKELISWAREYNIAGAVVPNVIAMADALERLTQPVGLEPLCYIYEWDTAIGLARSLRQDHLAAVPTRTIACHSAEVVARLIAERDGAKRLRTRFFTETCIGIRNEDDLSCRERSPRCDRAEGEAMNLLPDYTEIDRLRAELATGAAIVERLSALAEQMNEDNQRLAAELAKSELQRDAYRDAWQTVAAEIAELREQEPIAWRLKNGMKFAYSTYKPALCTYPDETSLSPLYASPVPAAQAVPVEFLLNGARLKLSFQQQECESCGASSTHYRTVPIDQYAEELQGRWVVLVPAENDRHLAMQTAQAVPDRDALIDLINEQIGNAYFCTRVWEAWHVGTMSDDDFEPVSESHATAELADAVIAMLSTAPQPPADQVPDAGKTIDHFPDATKMVANHREEPLGHE